MKRIGTFQGLRGAAILVIMLSHYISSLSHLGIGAGNTIFLVLSGFLAMYTWHPSQDSLWIQMGAVPTASSQVLWRVSRGNDHGDSVESPYVTRCSGSSQGAC